MYWLSLHFTCYALAHYKMSFVLCLPAIILMNLPLSVAWREWATVELESQHCIAWPQIYAANLAYLCTHSSTHCLPYICCACMAFNIFIYVSLALKAGLVHLLFSTRDYHLLVTPADEALYWLKCILRSEWLCMTSREMWSVDCLCMSTVSPCTDITLVNYQLMTVLEMIDCK